MDLPPSFSLTMPGGIPEVRCDGCGVSKWERATTEGTELLEVWAAAHKCEPVTPEG
jgi:hypothetical protein